MAAFYPLSFFITLGLLTLYALSQVALGVAQSMRDLRERRAILSAMRELTPLLATAREHSSGMSKWRYYNARAAAGFPADADPLAALRLEQKVSMSLAYGKKLLIRDLLYYLVTLLACAGVIALVLNARACAGALGGQLGCEAGLASLLNDPESVGWSATLMSFSLLILGSVARLRRINMGVGLCHAVVKELPAQIDKALVDMKSELVAIGEQASLEEALGAARETSKAGPARL